VLNLVEEAGVKPAPARSSGLFHTAILYPDRAALARVVKHIAASGYPLTGASDHLVSEAFYLDDPDGNGVELYRDRPRAEWKWNGETIEMATLPLDIADVFSAADREFDGAADGTRIGHVHLKVNGIAEAEAFYRDVIGFGVTTRFGDSATFLAAGGYHHHLGANIWQSRGAPAAGPGFARLREIVLIVPTGTDVDGIVTRAKAAGISAHREMGDVVLQDPWGHRILLEISPRRP
jgi:catechol 2,3-dioxygenase